MTFRRSPLVVLALVGLPSCGPATPTSPAEVAPAAGDPDRPPLRLDPVPGGFVADNTTFSADFLADAVVVRPHDRAPFALVPAAWGREEIPFEAVDPTTDGDRLVYRHEGVTAWWVSDEGGLEQGFDLDSPPPGDGPIRVRTEVDGADVRPDPSGAWILGDSPFLYTGASAVDALGRALPISIEADGALTLVVDDRGATYPISIDPLVLDVSATIDGGSASAGAGGAVAALDFNGDGKDDLAVGSPGSGKVNVYFGGASALSTTPGWTLTGTSAAGTGSVLGVINVSASGSEDLVVGEPDSGAGQIRVFFGATGTPDTTADVTLAGSSSGDAFGSALAVGDLDGSGSAVDLAVGAPSASSGAGKVYVFRGDATTIATTSSWSVTGSTSEKLGSALAVGTFKTNLALAAGAPGATNGKVYTYEKSGSSLSTSVTTTLTGAASGDEFGAALATGTFASGTQEDLLVGSPGAGSDAGKADIFGGSSSGLKTTSSWTVSGTYAAGRFGAAVAAGVDAEGSARIGVAVAAPDVSGDGRYQGGLVNYYKGSTSTISTTATRTLEAGQDGAGFGSSIAFGAFTEATYGDLAIGAPDYEATETGEGRTFLFLGNKDADSDGSPSGEDCDDSAASRTPFKSETYQTSWTSASTTDLDCDGYELYRVINDATTDIGPQITTAGANYDATYFLFSFTYAMSSDRAYIWYFDTGESGGETDFSSSTYSGAFPSDVELDTAADFMIATYGSEDLFAYDLTDGDSTDVTPDVAKIYRNSYSTASGQGYLRISWDQLYGLGDGVVPAGAEIRVLGVVRNADDGAPSDTAPDNILSPYTSWLTIHVDMDGDGAPDTATEPFEDGDGDGYDVAVDGDCDDASSTVHPGVLDVPGDGVDSDCDGSGSGATADDDGDGLTFAEETVYGSSDANADDDGDGIATKSEGTTDTDGDGKGNFLDTDSDADGIPDATEGSGDTDGDGKASYLDTDADGDGIADATEGVADADSDKLGNFLDTDSDADGFLDRTEGTSDLDADGKGNYVDADDDGDAALTASEVKFSTEPYDDDTDDDGITDGKEWDYDAYLSDPKTIDQNNPQDTDGDKTIDARDRDDDADGIDTYDEGDLDIDGIGDCSDPFLVTIEGDGTPNYLDLDSDGDGFSDAATGSGSCGSWVEDASADVDSDGVVNAYDYCDCDGGAGDADGDGLSSKDERKFGLNASNPDSDADGVFDRLEVVAGTGGKIESVPDTDGDGTGDALDTDDDGDGVPTADELGEIGVDRLDTDGDRFYDTFLDTDGDTVADYLDADDDGDGVDTIDEMIRENAYSGEASEDSDGDGVLNYVDANDFDGPLEDQDRDGLRNDVEAALLSDPAKADTDADGVPDGVEVGDPGAPTNTDGDPDLDVDDADDDEDGHPTRLEGAFDVDQDGTPNHLDTDADGDGAPDADEGDGDADGDFVPDWLDADENDGPNADIHVRPPDDGGGPSGGGGGCATADGRGWMGILVAGALLGRRRRRRG